MRRLATLALFGALLITTISVGAQPAKAERDAPATLRVLNRDVITMRVPLVGASPAARVQRAEQRLREIPPSEIDNEIRTHPLAYGDARGAQLLLGDRLLFAVLEGDVDPTTGQTLPELVQQTVGRLEDVRATWNATRRWPIIAAGLIRAGVASAILLGAVFFVLYGFGALIAMLQRRRSARAAAGSSPFTWREVFARFVLRLTQAFKWLLILVLVYAWATYVLERFPLTEPIGRKLGKFIVDTVVWLGEGIVDGLPGIVSVLVVLTVTRVIIDALGHVFESVRAGRLHVSMLHPETIGATRRIVTVIVWCLGFAVAYPFIPGSDSEAFKGLSVLLGLMLSLGSTGLVTQAMSGLVIVYSRALRKGDFVRINDIEGVVTEVASLATKMVNVRNEEITIPNSVLVANPIHNFSKLAGTHGTLITSKVTIGYDAPWRQVHAMLITAAAKTPGVRTDPQPYVYQRALSDFYVEYEVFVHIDRAADRIPVLSALHANIQDEFNEHGVQIMSPHFLSQPDQPVLVQKSRWFKAPAEAGRDAA